MINDTVEYNLSGVSLAIHLSTLDQLVPLTKAVCNGGWYIEYYNFSIQNVNYSVQLVGPYWANGDINIWFTPDNSSRQGKDHMSLNTVFSHACDAAESNLDNGYGEKGITQPVNASVALYVRNPSILLNDISSQCPMMLNYACSQELRNGDIETYPYSISGHRHLIKDGSTQVIRISCWEWTGTNADGSSFTETNKGLRNQAQSSYIMNLGMDNLRDLSVVSADPTKFVCPESLYYSSFE